MSSLISWVSRFRSALLIGRSCELRSWARTARTRWSRSAWSRLASYSCGPSCLSSSAWTSCLSSSSRSCSALPRRDRTLVGVTGVIRDRTASSPAPASAPAPAPAPRCGGVSCSSGPRGGGGGGGAAPDSLCLRAAASRSARLLTMSPLDPEELGEPVVLPVRGTTAVCAPRPDLVTDEEGRELSECRARRVLRTGSDDRRAGVRGGGDVDRRGDLGCHVHPEDRLPLLRADADRVVGPVEQEVAMTTPDVQHLEG